VKKWTVGQFEGELEHQASRNIKNPYTYKVSRERKGSARVIGLCLLVRRFYPTIGFRQVLITVERAEWEALENPVGLARETAFKALRELDKAAKGAS
jgi:hypothetical protein